MRADHVSERRVDGIEIKVIDPVALPVFHHRRNRATLQEPEARSPERPRLDVRHGARRARGPRITRQTSHDPEAPRRATRELSEQLMDPLPAKRRDCSVRLRDLVRWRLSQRRLAPA